MSALPKTPQPIFGVLISRNLDGTLDLTGENYNLQQLGFPVLPQADIPPCGTSVLCDRERMCIKFMESPSLPKN